MSTPDPDAAIAHAVLAVATAPAPGSASLAAVQPADAGTGGPHRTVAQVVKDIVLFVASPFVTLAYVFLFPFIGAVMLAQAWRHRKETGRSM